MSCCSYCYIMQYQYARDSVDDAVIVIENVEPCQTVADAQTKPNDLAVLSQSLMHATFL